ncbi:MAG: calcium-chelating exported protein [Candidatus Berkelbacteria bacterium Licking1014_7]|uniref:Calcium-chelating exported protein n=1 Tax=Candidatus Berkelbacteria bacterium Licking1014_7 TaxID=2017147 RepID=A0A554LJD3_9BACT|nr:MAG: calcium-chelating exported protein [Candidatus Berkelbacteria bacterium Licking1014_7]
MLNFFKKSKIGLSLLAMTSLVAISGIFTVSRAFSAKTEYLPENIIEKINNQRKNFDLSELVVDVHLENAALSKAHHIIEHNYFDHYSPDGVSPWDFILSSGYDYRYAAENLAINYTDSAEVVTAWMVSESHRKNILNPKYENIGVGIATGKVNGSDSAVTVLMLGKEMASSYNIFDLSVTEMIRNLLNIRLLPE